MGRLMPVVVGRRRQERTHVYPSNEPSMIK
jgi:hypothetical protein